MKELSHSIFQTLNIHVTSGGEMMVKLLWLIMYLDEAMTTLLYTSFCLNCDSARQMKNVMLNEC